MIFYGLCRYKDESKAGTSLLRIHHRSLQGFLLILKDSEHKTFWWAP